MKKLLLLSVMTLSIASHAQMVSSDYTASSVVYSENIQESSILVLGTQDEYKNRKPGTAFLLSFLVSGGGQFYNGQNGKGAIMLGTSVLGIGLAINGLKSDDNGGISTPSNGGQATAGVLLALGAGLWSMIDAPIMASKLNKQNGLTLKVEPNLQMNDRGHFTLGPKLSFNF